MKETEQEFSFHGKHLNCFRFPFEKTSFDDLISLFYFIYLLHFTFSFRILRKNNMPTFPNINNEANFQRKIIGYFLNLHFIYYQNYSKLESTLKDFDPSFRYSIGCTTDYLTVGMFGQKQ